MHSLTRLPGILACLGSFATVISKAPSGPWDTFNYSPSSKTVFPTSVYRVIGDVRDPEAILTKGGTTTIVGRGSWFTLDFGKEVGGILSLDIEPASSNAELHFTWTESRLYVSNTTSDGSTMAIHTSDNDGVVRTPIPLASGRWTQPRHTQRGGFRFLTIASNSDTEVALSNPSIEITFMPHVNDLRDYSGYFYAKDSVFHDEDFLTKLWYAGAYTIQMNILAVDEGRTIQPKGWASNATIGIDGPLLVDGAKRDRQLWPGDLGIAVPSAFVSMNDMLPTKNALASLFTLLDPETGELPYSGPPLNFRGSFAYHAWTLYGVHLYHLYTGDTAFVSELWANYTKAVSFLEHHVDGSGFVNVTVQPDWGRMGGTGHGAPANFLFYKVLINSAELAMRMDQPDRSSKWLEQAKALKTAINKEFWSEKHGMYRDTPDSSVFPQDANSYAVVFNITDSNMKNEQISDGLLKNWGEFGPVSPELPDTVIPFIGGFEVQAHFIASQDERALDLLRLEWGYMLYTNLSVESTLLEGWTANGSLGYRGQYEYNYDFSYTSHSHAWSTGPTAALTFYVVGLQIVSTQGKDWLFSPHTGSLSAAQGGFETPLGSFSASWSVNATHFIVALQTPSRTRGVLRIPGKGPAYVDGNETPLHSEGFVLEGGNYFVVTRVETLRMHFARDVLSNLWMQLNRWFRQTLTVVRKRVYDEL